MKMYYYKGPQPNFGDELNEWMWPRLLPGFFDGNEDNIFLGIGSILFDFHPQQARKIVFGAGYGGYTAPPRIDANWDFYFVRGPITARAVGVKESLGVGDAAILLRSCIDERPQKRYPVSFVPHWESIADGNWEAACEQADMHFIDPRAPVEQVLDEILASELVVTEAMHGAIVSDALRVPWVPARPIQNQHRLKWQDWAQALDIDLRPQALQPSTGLEVAMHWLGTSKKNVGRLRRRGQFLKTAAAPYFRDKAARSLRQLARARPSLSSDAAIQNAHQIMVDQLGVLRQRCGIA